MALTHRRPDQAVADGLARWLAHRHGVGPVVIDQLRRPSSGYSSETVFAEASWSTERGPEHRSLVVRMPPAGIGTFDRHDLGAELEAQLAAAAAGVPVADPEVESDPSWLGTPFMVMARVEGHIIGALAHLDRWLTGQSAADQGRLFTNFIATLCTIHRSDVSAAPNVPERSTADDLDFWAEYLDWSSDGNPVPPWSTRLDWCRRHRPTSQPDPALLWGDARFENMVIGDEARAGGRARLGHGLDRGPRTRPGLVHQSRPDHVPPVRAAPGRVPRPGGHRRPVRGATADGRCGTSSGTRPWPWCAARRS